MFSIRIILPRVKIIIPPNSPNLLLYPLIKSFSTTKELNSKASKNRNKLNKSPILKSLQQSSTNTTKTTDTTSKVKEDLRGTGVGASYELYSKNEKVLGRDELNSEEKPIEEEFKIEDGKIVKNESTTESSIPSTSTSSSSASSPATSPSTTPTTSTTIPTPPIPKVTLLEYSDLENPPPQEIPSIDERIRQQNRSRYPNHEEEESTIYTANPPFKVPLMLTAAFVFSVFALNAADTVRVGLSTYNEETGINELASGWKRYSLAGLFLGIGVAAFSWAVLAPARIVTRLTLRKPLNSPINHYAYPRESLISIHTPITKLPFLSSRIIKLSQIHLLGPISDSPKPYHPEEYIAPELPKKTGVIANYLREVRYKYFITSKPKKPLVPWAKEGNKKTSHSPIIIKGDRASYSLAVRRGDLNKMDDETGAWAQDWNMLERSLLGLEHEGDVVTTDARRK